MFNVTESGQTVSEFGLYKYLVKVFVWFRCNHIQWYLNIYVFPLVSKYEWERNYIELICQQIFELGVLLIILLGCGLD